MLNFNAKKPALNQIQIPFHQRTVVNSLPTDSIPSHQYSNNHFPLFGYLCKFAIAASESPPIRSLAL